VGKIRFCVDDVKSAQERLPVKNAKFQLEKQLVKQLLAFSHNDTFEFMKAEGRRQKAEGNPRLKTWD
jgi:hypothetical protein